MKKNKIVLIFGITGQDGSYLAEFLIHKNYNVHGVFRRSAAPNTHRIDHLIDDNLLNKNNSKLTLHYGDITDTLSINNIIERVMPDEIYNLGAQSHVKVSFDIPEYTYNTNALGTLRILEAIKNTKKNIKYIQASTSEMFGNKSSGSLDEKSIFEPVSPYASAKLLAFWTTKNYRLNYNIHASNVIMFNHESPRRGLNFVTKKIIRGLCEIKKGKKNILFLGNIYSKRDWGYAKEYSEALWKILQLKDPTDLVLATGKNYSVKEFIELACIKIGIDIKWKGKGINEIAYDLKTKKTIIKISKKYFRDSEVNTLLGNSKKAKKIIKWKPKVSISKLIDIMVTEENILIDKNRFY